MPREVPLRLSIGVEHVRRFADASGDRNPLHLDESFARQTPYGRCIVHGALVTIAALGRADANALACAQTIDIQFKQPVFPGEAYPVTCTEADERTRVEVTMAGLPVTTIAVVSDRGAPPLPPASQSWTRAHPSSPRSYGIGDLRDEAVSFSVPYGCRLDLLESLAADLGAAGVPTGLLAWLSAASYAIGMLVPGRDAVFAGARIARSSGDASGTLGVSVTTADDRTGLVVVEAALSHGEFSAQMTLNAFLRPTTPAPDRSTLGRHLAPSSNLAGQNVLVIGASRGLGAALSGAFAMQAATVWAAFAESADRAEKLPREFGAERIRLLQFDATDSDQSRRAFDKVRTQAGALDAVVLCAAPPPFETALHPDRLPAMLDYVSASTAMALTPLTQALPLLSPEASIIVMSSAALDEVPKGWPHYVVAKAALEGAATYCAHHTAARVLVVRPPKMWTDSTNTPLGRIAAVPVEQVAAAIVSRIAADSAPPGLSVLTSEQLMKQ
jgi:NAD(P)-dependent dehydrogenase (short-subunit alcohol dehydrogenase family)/acyl dehydratase